MKKPNKSLDAELAALPVPSDADLADVNTGGKL